MRFEFRILNDAGEVIAADHTTLSTIDQFGGCESVDIHVAAALRYARTIRNRGESNGENT